MVEGPAPIGATPGDQVITYRLRVENSTTFPLDYDLVDEFAFGSGIVPIGSPSVTGPVGVTVETSFDGVDRTAVATGARIPAGFRDAPRYHDYLVTVPVNATGLIPHSAGGPSSGACRTDGDGGLATVVGVVSGDLAATGAACAPVGLPTVTHQVLSSAPIGEGRWEVSYLVTVDNAGAAPVTYDVGQEFLFAPAVHLVGVPTVATAPADLTVEPGFDGREHTTIATGQLLGVPGEEGYEPHRYTVTAVSDVPIQFNEDNGGAEQALCARPRPRHETAKNSIVNIRFAQQDWEAGACAPLPNIFVAPVAGAGPVPTGDGAWRQSYRATVTNPSEAAASVSLTQAFRGSAGLEVETVELTGAVGVLSARSGDSLRFAEDLIVPAGASFTFEVAVTARPTDAASGAASSQALTAMTLDPGCADGPALTTLAGTLGWESNGLTAVEETCASFARPTMSAEVIASEVLDGDRSRVEYEIVVTNDAEIEAWYDLDDELQFGPGITVEDVTVSGTAEEWAWDGGDELVLARQRAIGADTGHTYRIAVVASVPAADPSSAVFACFDDPGTASGFTSAASLWSFGGAATVRACAAPLPRAAATPEPEPTTGVTSPTTAPSSPAVGTEVPGAEPPPTVAPTIPVTTDTPVANPLPRTGPTATAQLLAVAAFFVAGGLLLLISVRRRGSHLGG